MFKSATRGRSTPSSFRAQYDPMNANCSRNSGVQSAVAPQSMSMTLPVAVGIIGPMAARRMPFTRRTVSVAAESSAPVDPADTNASPPPSRSICKPTTIEDCGFFFRTVAGSSCISTTSSAFAISTPFGSVWI